MRKICYRIPQNKIFEVSILFYIFGKKYKKLSLIDFTRKSGGKSRKSRNAPAVLYINFKPGEKFSPRFRRVYAACRKAEIVCGKRKTARADDSKNFIKSRKKFFIFTLRRKKNYGFGIFTLEIKG